MRSQESPVIGEIVHARPGLLDFLSLPWLPRSTVQIKRSVVWWWVVWVLGGVEIGRGVYFFSAAIGRNSPDAICFGVACYIASFSWTADLYVRWW